MGGVTGVLVDAFQRQKEDEYEKILELCHLHGITLSKNLLEKGTLDCAVFGITFDKITNCRVLSHVEFLYAQLASHYP